jgi:energy-coupling factor transporter ATP-binding protein EcfA2
MSADPIAVIEDIRFSYGRREGVLALDGVSLELERGSVLGLIGGNGSGKTTLARHLNGLLRPSTGRVMVEGLDTARHDVRVLARHVGYVFQNPSHQLFARTVAEELAFGPRNLECSPEEVDGRVGAAAETLGLTDVLQAHPRRLPFPLRKLVAIAAVLTMRPSLLVLDEATIGQDDRMARRIADLIHELRDGGTTVVCATHDLALVAGVADRLVVLRDGRVVADDTPRTVLSDRALMAATGLTPPQITQLSLSMPDRVGRPAALSIDELVAEVRAAS